MLVLRLVTIKPHCTHSRFQITQPMIYTFFLLHPLICFKGGVCHTSLGSLSFLWIRSNRARMEWRFLRSWLDRDLLPKALRYGFLGWSLTAFGWFRSFNGWKRGWTIFPWDKFWIEWGFETFLLLISHWNLIGMKLRLKTTCSKLMNFSMSGVGFERKGISRKKILGFHKGFNGFPFTIYKWDRHHCRGHVN